MEKIEGEKIFERLTEIKKDVNDSLIQAAIIFCDEQEIEFEEFAKMIDKNTLQLIKIEAAQLELLKRRERQILNNTLDI